jgi:hypothetical protein
MRIVKAEATGKIKVESETYQGYQITLEFTDRDVGLFEDAEMQCVVEGELAGLVQESLTLLTHPHMEGTHRRE